MLRYLLPTLLLASATPAAAADPTLNLLCKRQSEQPPFRMLRVDFDQSYVAASWTDEPDRVAQYDLIEYDDMKIVYGDRNDTSTVVMIDRTTGAESSLSNPGRPSYICEAVARRF